MEKYTLTFKNGDNPPNCLMTGHRVKDGWMVEIWDVKKDFHLLKPTQDVLNDRKAVFDFLKTITPPAEIKNLWEDLIEEKRDNSYGWDKYANKRYKYTEQEFNEKFETLKQL